MALDLEAWAGEGGYVPIGDELHRLAPAVGQFQLRVWVSAFDERLAFVLAEAVLERRLGRLETLQVPRGVEHHGDVGLVVALRGGHQAWSGLGEAARLDAGRRPVIVARVRNDEQVGVDDVYLPVLCRNGGLGRA